MACNRFRTSFALGVALALSVWVAVAPAASARWVVHNDADVTEIKAPPGGTQRQTCANKLRGRSGWSALVPQGQDPRTFGPLPDLAFAGVRYEVWKAPAGFRDFNAAEEVDSDGDGVVETYLFTDESGNQSSATLVKRFRTDPRTRLRPPEPVFPPVDPTTDNLYVLTGVSFVARFAAGTVSPGDTLGVKPRSGGSTLINLRAIRC